jgi:hypothetical protein
MRAKTVNERMDFERGIDPKKSMGIGYRKFLESEYKRFSEEKLYYDQIEEELGLEKYKLNDDNKLFITLVFVDMLKNLSLGETFPNSFQDSYKTAVFVSSKLSSKISPSLVMDICRKIFYDKYGLEWKSQGSV